MKVHLGLTYSLLLLLLVLQFFLFTRQGKTSARALALERSLSLPDADDGVSRRISALQRTVDKLATAQSRSGGGAAAVAAEEGSTQGAGEDAAVDRRAQSDPATDGDPREDDLATTNPLLRLHTRRQQLEQIRDGLVRLDANADTRVSLREFEGNVDDFMYFDANASGRISRSEIERVIATEQKAIDEVMARDQDGDGVIAPYEFNRSTRTFRYFDENDDGILTSEEYVSAHWRVRNRFGNDDIDEDRKLAPEEFSGGSAKFKKYDVDGDGFMDRSEFEDLVHDGH